MFAEEEVVKEHRGRASAIGNIVVITFGIILARLWYLQVYRGNVYLTYSLKNRLRKEVIKAPRGMIFSRNDKLLVNNVPRFDAVLTPQYFTNKKETLKKLSKILELPVSTIKRILKKNMGQAKYKPIIIKKNISRKEVAVIETENNDLPGISVETFISREYRDGVIGAHLLGYISEISSKQIPRGHKDNKPNYKLGDFVGQFGLEEELDLLIRGEDGYEYVEVDALGRKKRHLGHDELFKNIKNTPSRPGANVRLTIDSDLQVSAFEALEGKVGSAVVLDVKTGEVLAMVSRPSFDPSQFSRGLSTEYWNSLRDNPNNPLRDRTIQEHYSPGSTFKMVTALTALEEKMIDPNTTIFCDGTLKLGRKTYHCWREFGHGRVNMRRALKESCNIYFQRIAKKMDIDVLARYAKMLGFNSPTGIALPRERSGLIPDREWKLKRNGVEWQLGETLSCAIGQSYVLVSPLQLAQAYAVIANGGKIHRPYVVKEIVDDQGKAKKSYDPTLVKNIKISPRTLSIIKEGLHAVVNEVGGTAFASKGKGLNMAGKTGTAQVIRMNRDKLFSKCDKNEFKYRNHGVFAGFAPADDPRIAVAVIVEHGCAGSKSAAPVAKQVVTTYMAKYMPEKRKKLIEIENQRQKRMAALRARQEEEE